MTSMIKPNALFIMSTLYRRAFGDVHNNIICSAKKLHVDCFEIVTPSSSLCGQSPCRCSSRFVTPTQEAEPQTPPCLASPGEVAMPGM